MIKLKNGFVSVNKKLAPSKDDIKSFLNKLDFMLPIGYLEFLKESNGAEIANEENYVLLWRLTDLFDLNLAYDVSSFASDFFIIGSNGGDTAYAVQKLSGKIFSFPFIGMSNEEALF